MANYRCNDCGLDLMDDDIEPEPCPRCGKQMERSEGVVLKNFGGGGVASIGRDQT